MDTTSSRPYMAIFAVIALIVAGFVIKQEYSSANKTEDQIAAESPQRMLVEGKDGRVPEPIPDWFKRVGYQKLGFESQQEMDDTQKLMAVKRQEDYTPDQLQLIHKLVASKGIPQQMGISLLPGLRPKGARKDFVPDVKSLFVKGSPNQAFTTVLSTWCQSGDEDLVKSLAKDPDKDLAAKAQQIVTDFEFPGKDV